MSGLKLVDSYAHRAEQLGVPRASGAFWPTVKFIHAIGIGSATRFFDDIRLHKVSVVDWSTIRDYAISNRERLKQTLKHDPAKWVANVDAVMSRGRRLAESSKNCAKTPS